MPTVKLIVEYDGTAYAGWQRQPDQLTIQEALETAVKQLTQIDVSVLGAGRTDAGVHALGQVVSFRIEKNWTPDEWTKGMNARLAKDITVRTAAIMPDDFHARHAARGKLGRDRQCRVDVRSGRDHRAASRRKVGGGAHGGGAH